ncbi:MAG: 1-deoxy-D-xylulose-5-phosphate reductoisomerase, partial [Solirubrobacterales bacterium]|nr:1-deoxy-D-xylulose-5-phosphate reductoisomerase [Solirubrobacterales bacterium]
DGATLAHLGYPDMQVPIAYALHYPERVPVPVRPLDLAELGALTFEPPDPDTFACLRLARDAGEAGGTAGCVLNAADEVAVAAFLDGRIPFTAIAAVVDATLEAVPPHRPSHFEDLFAVDAEARRRAGELCERAGAVR